MDKKRESYLEWTEYFMATAFLAAKRSKDPNTQVGACIVNKDRIIVGIGYNGFPNGCSDQAFPWNKNTPDPLDSKYMYVCHAEVNAVLNKNCSDIKGSTMYVVLFPCNECAKIIIQSGIRYIVYMSDKNGHKKETVAAKKMLTTSGVIFEQFLPKRSTISVDFLSIDNLMDELTLTTTPVQSEIETAKYYITWSEFFMTTAFLAAKRSKDPNTQVGACIVNAENKLVGIGYNGFPIGCSDDLFPWARDNHDPLLNKYMYVCHAELNAILNKNMSSLNGCTIYTTLFPCNECAKLIIQSRIILVIYAMDKYTNTPSIIAAKRMFDAVGISYRQFVPKSKRILIDFTKNIQKSLNQ